MVVVVVFAKEECGFVVVQAEEADLLMPGIDEDKGETGPDGRSVQMVGGTLQLKFGSQRTVYFRRKGGLKVVNGHL